MQREKEAPLRCKSWRGFCFKKHSMETNTQKFWEAKPKHGAIKYKDPQKLWDDCVAYFEWCDANPILEQKMFAHDGSTIKDDLEKPRAFTQQGLCAFLNIHHSTWLEWRKNENDLSEITRQVDAIMYEQKFTGAAAGVFNSSIIARDLGLVDKSHQEGEVKHSGEVTITRRTIK